MIDRIEKDHENLDEEFEKFREKPTEPENKLQKFLSLRDFLKLSWLFTGSILTYDIYAINKLIKSGDLEDLADYQKALWKLSPEQRQILKDIESYRKDLGLDYKPFELVQAIMNNSLANADTNESPPPSLFNTKEVPKFNLSYAQRVEEICRTILGLNFAKLVRGVSFDKNSPYGFFFNPANRTVQLGAQVNEIPMTPDFNNFTAHEALGHGTDPDLGGSQIYSLDQMLQVELGKWMALSRMFDIKDQFLNHPGDMMKPFLARKIGKEIALTFSQNQEQQSLNWIGAGILYEEIKVLATAKNCAVENLKFNKAACKIIGLKLIDGMRTQVVKLKNSAKQAYEDGMATVGHEIYAEMVRYSLMHRDLIGYDQTVIKGIALALRGASGGEFDFNRADDVFNMIDPEVARRNDQEQELISEFKEEDYPKESTEQEAEIIEDLSGMQELEKTYQEHTESGEVKDQHLLPEPVRALATTYMNLINQIINVYPFMQRAEHMYLDESFDPNLHIWEIEEIEGALESTFTSRLIFNEIEDQNYLEGELKWRNQVLKSFISSEAFGS
jgi:hypothetical protein